MLEMAPSAPVPEPDLDFKDETKSKQAKAATLSLLDKFRADALAGKRAGILPIRVSFPAFGPSLFLDEARRSEIPRHRRIGARHRPVAGRNSSQGRDQSSPHHRHGHPGRSPGR